MSTRKIYKAAIVGTGRIGLTYDDEVGTLQPPECFQSDMRHSGLYTILPVNHAESYIRTEGYELIAASDHNPDKLRELSRRTGVEATYTDYREMLEKERPDIVSVCTQSAAKAEVTVAAAEADVKAIIVEKAMATSMAEADWMIEVCKQNDVTLVVNHPNRFSPMNRHALAAIQSGEIGEVCAVSAFAPSGMLHVGTHTFDMMRFWAGEVIKVNARIPNFDLESDLPATGTLEFANGVVGFFDHVHRACPGYEARGTTGMVRTSSLVGDGWLYKSEPLNPDNKRGYPGRLMTTPLGAEQHEMSMTQRMLAELHEHVSTGAPFVSSAEDGAKALEIGLACYASHLAGGPVTLPLKDRTLRVPNR